ncbi:Lnb N-terminal periplasmic domain-containing protein [Aquirufa sp. HETE-40SA]
MKKILLFLLISLAAKAQLSSKAEVVLVTVAPGKELHSAFGHTILWINDSSNGIDRAYSYGTFDFRTENFYLKFLMGTLPYTISVHSMRDEFEYNAQYEKRGMIAQKLQLDSLQKNAIFQALENNLLPENREYAYKFFYDNCSTRIRDMIERNAPGKYAWKQAPNLEGKSYRDWMNNYLAPNSWVTLGMNLALGVPSNVKATASQSCYLPDNLASATNLAKGLSANPVTLFEADASVVAPFDFTGPYVILSILSLLVGFFSFKVKFPYAADVALFSVIGVLAWFIFFLGTATNHEVMAWNPASLMLFPFNFPLVFWFAKNPLKWKKYLQIISVLCLIGLIWSGMQFTPVVLIGLPIFIRVCYLSFIKK